MTMSLKVSYLYFECYTDIMIYISYYYSYMIIKNVKMFYMSCDINLTFLNMSLLQYKQII